MMKKLLFGSTALLAGITGLAVLLCVAPAFNHWLWPLVIIGVIVLALIAVGSLPLLLTVLALLFMAAVVAVCVGIALPLILPLMIPVFAIYTGVVMLWQCRRSKIKM